MSGAHISTPIQGLDLRPGLTVAIAALLPEDVAVDIPLSPGFQRQGLIFRSAILLQLAARKQPLSLVQLQGSVHHKCQPSRAISPPTTGTWQYQLKITPGNWLEFQLMPESLGRWLDLWETELQILQDAPPLATAIAKIEVDPDLLFGWHYLQSQCQDFLTLAHSVAPNVQGAWHFPQGYPAWEQGLLEAVVKLSLAIADHHYRPHHLQGVAQAFWEFQRHCTPFAYYPKDPLRFAHYRRWFGLVGNIFQSFLTAYGDRPMAADAETPSP